MNHQEEQELLSQSTLPVLSRLDRLDRLVSDFFFCVCIMKSSTEDQCKTLAYALEEVNYKGTLMERLTMLENRVLELSLVMEEVEKTSRSSSCTIERAEKIEHKLSFTAITSQDDDTINSSQGTTNLVEASACERKSKGGHKDRRWRNVALIRHNKWLGWFPMGC
ncbi:hypothetical protein CICLE_v10002723mg [Citrus x clementina]|uniref:Uncharacterized protein n=1 Tax=Citrus clementina TaxID=85681 RepID=V4SWL3_CITCL|nr:hypothetical protein CICLE_v10002723mg [Citrus x clementina]